jgi:Na+/melibiose symporter-like transporter
MQAALVQQGLSSPSTLSFVGSLNVTLIAILATVNVRLIRKLGARNTGLLGVSFLGVGEILSGFLTHNLGGLFVTVGIIMGIGTR